MTKPTGNPRGRPKKKIILSGETAAFFRAAQDSQLPDGGDRRVLRCIEEIKQRMSINMRTAPGAAIWLGALFIELEFRLLCDNAEMSFVLQTQKTVLTMKGKRTRRCVMLVARAYECATGKRAAEPYRKRRRCNGPFLRFVKIAAKNSRAAGLWPDTDQAWKGTIGRALKLRDDPGQREFEGLALCNFLHGKRAPFSPRIGTDG
ncbi:MAG: hypothetical protein ACREDD_05000 [Methylocella sp.]